ncbi:hypothetical protein FA95DRAFT_1612363 [Auriscalpium vulgare]|uniref:Uncharacterized protein n=1 Tax=Auriscalpium vulgare TaxID=40419 RepID=A0ACB8R6L4_9AGAM|nr:hypothetical protein FA95DRAFT_1612363 [Auriscalpium vulgare]
MSRVMPWAVRYDLRVRAKVLLLTELAQRSAGEMSSVWGRTALKNAVHLPIDLRQLALIRRDVTNDGIKELREGDLSHLVQTEYADGESRSFFNCNGYLIGFHFPQYLTEKESRDHADHMLEFAAVYPPTMSADKAGRGASEEYRQQNGNVIGCTHISLGWKEIGKPHMPSQPSKTFCASNSKRKAAAVERVLSWLAPFQYRLDHLLQMTAPEPRLYCSSVVYIPLQPLELLEDLWAAARSN